MAFLFGDNIYIRSENNQYRYALGETDEDRPIVYCFGINPSTATPEKLDNTVTRVKNIARFNGFNGWCMLNIYPQRATDPNNLDAEVNEIEHIKNKNIIQDLISEGSTVWCAWGNLILKRPYLRNCLMEIFSNVLKQNIRYVTVGGVTSAGHPRHPLYQKTSKFIEFNILNYFTNIRNIE
jgi:hypothetical protein